MVKNQSFYLNWSWNVTGSWWTDRWTDKQMDGRTDGWTELP